MQLFPDLAAIGQLDLQVYCNEWLQRPLARDCGIAQIVVDSQLNMQVMLDEAGAVFRGDEVFIPIDEPLVSSLTVISQMPMNDAGYIARFGMHGTPHPAPWRQNPLPLVPVLPTAQTMLSGTVNGSATTTLWGVMLGTSSTRSKLPGTWPLGSKTSP